MKTRKTLVVGLGEVGGSLADVLDTTDVVLRHDIALRDIQNPIGVMHLCFPYQTREQFEDAALGYIRRFRPELTIINSTVTPGTTRRLASRSATPIAFSPVRGKHIRMSEDLRRYVKFVAGTDFGATETAQAHFQQAGLRVRVVHGIETLELAKLAETTYFGLLIAFAQEMNRYAERVGGDYFELASFFEEIDFFPPTRYFPGFIGGHCVVPNIKLLSQVAPSKLFEAILSSNDQRAVELENAVTSAGQIQQSFQDKPDGKVLSDQ